MATGKRKRHTEGFSTARSPAMGTISGETSATESTKDIDRLVSEVAQSRRNYNNIAELISLARQQHAPAVVALCRIFCRLIAADNMKKSKSTSKNELDIVDWLKQRYLEYTTLLLEDMSYRNLHLLMRLIGEESRAGNEQVWRAGLFPQLMHSVLIATETASLREEFMQEWACKYDDVRFYAFQTIAQTVQKTQAPEQSDSMINASLNVLAAIGVPPETKKELVHFHGDMPAPSTKHPLLSLSALKKQAQEAWLSLIRSGLDNAQRKYVLTILTRQIVPWFLKVEILMDFLTDSYNVGGSTSLLALSGLFYLIQEKNLDYPSFYHKLYSLLDDSVLHSKHRSRFLRLLETFMSSTHLPAALVASFVKRLSRLALHAPPAAIVAIVPWIYNMLKKHPTCTFMIHREVRDPVLRKVMEEEGMNDPFDMEVTDPMETGAIDTSLWEIETLQSHYHPNVASIAKIISTQFTKQAYNVEDFLDHSYRGLLDAELGRDLKKAPVVEYQIPKRMFTEDDVRLNRLGGLLTKVMEYECDADVFD